MKNQEQGQYTAANGSTVQFWKRAGETMLINTEGEIIMVDKQGETYGAASKEAGLKLLGWEN